MIDFLVLFLILLQLADAVLTLLIVRAGGHEMNPLLVRLDAWLRSTFDTGARWAWLAVAKGGAIALLALVWIVGLWNIPIAAAFLGAVTVIYVQGVRHNWLEYRQVRP